MEPETLDQIIARLPAPQAPTTESVFVTGVMERLPGPTPSRVAWMPLAASLAALSTLLIYLDTYGTWEPLPPSLAEALLLMPATLVAAVLIQLPRVQGSRS